MPLSADELARLAVDLVALEGPSGTSKRMACYYWYLASYPLRLLDFPRNLRNAPDRAEGRIWGLSSRYYLVNDNIHVYFVVGLSVEWYFGARNVPRRRPFRLQASRGPASTTSSASTRLLAVGARLRRR